MSSAPTYPRRPPEGGHLYCARMPLSSGHRAGGAGAEDKDRGRLGLDGCANVGVVQGPRQLRVLGTGGLGGTQLLLYLFPLVPRTCLLF